MTTTKTPPARRDAEAAPAGHRPDRRMPAARTIRALLTKIVLLGLLDAVAVYAAFVLALQAQWVVLAILAIVTIAVNVVYFRGGWLPAKYLVPGVLFLLVFQIFVVVYNGYVAFTNYGDGHNSTKEDAIEAIVARSLERVPDSPAYQLTIVEQFGVPYFLVTDPDDGDVFLGGADRPLERVEDFGTDGTGKADEVPGYTTLTFQDLVSRQREIAQLSVPRSDDPNDGALRTPDGLTAYLYLSTLSYDEAADTFTDTRTGAVYRDNGEGEFATEDGQALEPGWKIDVGFANFARAFGEESIRGPLFNTALWTFAFAFLSVFTTFALGLFLAIVLNDWRMRGRRLYRTLLILPYAFPAFLSGLVWAGMLNQDFGWINQVLLGGADIPWLTDPWLAKLSVLTLNLWLGFPYFFLVCTGALQAIPDELIEAARTDGARPWAIFRLVKLPLLLVSVAPLLIASFAFNFNNFNVIYMLTGGGPRDVEAGVSAGATDLLITLVYKVAFGSGTGRDYGLASAFAILIFIVVAIVSIIGFRQTKALEELN